jgi:hypothetical protein
LPNEDARVPRGAYAPRSWWFRSADICRRNCDLCDTRTPAYKSGGHHPVVLALPCMRSKARITDNRGLTQHPRAAGVSPPWFGNRPRNRKRFSQTESLPAPQLAYTSRSWLIVRMRLQTAILTDGVATLPTAGLRQPHLRQSSASGEGSHVAVGLPPPSQLFNPQGSFATAPERVSADLAANCVCPDGTIETQRRGRDRHHRHGDCAPLSK